MCNLYEQFLELELYINYTEQFQELELYIKLTLITMISAITPETFISLYVKLIKTAESLMMK